MGVSLNDKQNLLLDHFSNLTAIDQKPFLFLQSFCTAGTNTQTPCRKLTKYQNYYRVR